MDAALASTALQSARLSTAQSQAKAATGNAQTARKAAEEFESVFLTTMLEGMFTGLDAEPPFGGGSTEKTYRSLLVQEYAKQISGNGGLGIADQITRDLIALQEDAQK